MSPSNRKTTTVRTVAVCIDTRDGAGRKRLHGVSQYARQHGWRMMLVRREDREAAQEVLRLRPDGIIAYVADRYLLDAARRLRIPLADTAHGEVEVPLLISLDNDIVGRMAAEHLLSMGLQNFGYCGVRGRSVSEERRAALARHLASRGRTLQAFTQRIAEGESRLDPLIHWLQKLPKPGGVLAFDDKLGERVLTACRWAGLAVPGGVAVLGIGDDELMCEVSCPTLSSVSFPTHRLGFEAAAMLDQAMQGRRIADPHRKIPPTGVAARESTDSVAVADPLIKAAMLLIRQRAGEPIGVWHIARALDVSRRTLDRRFSAVFGRTVHDELTAVRMQIARQLLTGGRTPVCEIAGLCGYTTPASFSRAFRQHTGRWPTEVRSEESILP